MVAPLALQGHSIYINSIYLYTYLYIFIIILIYLYTCDMWDDGSSPALRAIQYTSYSWKAYFSWLTSKILIHINFSNWFVKSSFYPLIFVEIFKCIILYIHGRANWAAWRADFQNFSSLLSFRFLGPLLFVKISEFLESFNLIFMEGQLYRQICCHFQIYLIYCHILGERKNQFGIFLGSPSWKSQKLVTLRVIWWSVDLACVSIKFSPGPLSLSHNN